MKKEKQDQEPKENEVYEPREDSVLLLNSARNFAKGDVFEMGCGSGYVSLGLMKDGNINSICCADINPKAVRACQKAFSEYKQAHKKNIKYKVFESDLFGNPILKETNKKYDLILFNPPYLPEEKNKELNDPALNGGLLVIFRFLSQAKGFLKPNGKVFLLFSSLTGRNKILSFARNKGYSYKLVQKKRIFFEILYVYSFKF